MNDDKPEVLNPQPQPAGDLLAEDFRDTPSPQPEPRESQPSPEANQLAIDIRAGLEAAGINPDAMDEESLQEFQEIIHTQRLLMLQNQAATSFIVHHHADFVPSPQNAEVMQEALTRCGLDGTDPRHYEVAFNMCRDRIAGPEGARPTSLSLSEHQSTRQPVAPAMSEEDLRRKLDSMPLEEARRFMLQQMQR